MKKNYQKKAQFCVKNKGCAIEDDFYDASLIKCL